MTDLTNRPRDMATHILEQDWGPAFAREFDLVIAANVHHEMKSREILTDVVLAQRVASICRPFDRDLRENSSASSTSPPWWAKPTIKR